MRFIEGNWYKKKPRLGLDTGYLKVGLDWKRSKGIKKEQGRKKQQAEGM